MRIISFLIVISSALFLPVWAFALCALAHALVYTPFELLPLAVLVDAQFGEMGRIWYLYTGIAGSISIATVFIKPHLRFYA